MEQARTQPTRSSTAAACAICQCPLAPGEPKVACPACHAAYHADCWQENKGCAIYGCPQVPPTEHREATEIPVSYWGQESKPCPSCRQVILAAAVRCRHCGATFASARPEQSSEFRIRTSVEERLPALRRQIVWFFIFCAVPCLAPFAAIVGTPWYLAHRAEIRALPPLHSGLCRLGLAVAVGQTALVIVMAILFGVFSGS